MPAFGPKREMRGEGFEHGCRGDPRHALIGERGGGVFEIARRRDEIDADPDDHEIEPAGRRHFRFEQDTGEFAAAGQEIVRPFEAQLQAGPGELIERVTERQRRDKAELRGARRRPVRPQDQG